MPSPRLAFAAVAAAAVIFVAGFCVMLLGGCASGPRPWSYPAPAPAAAPAP